MSGLWRLCIGISDRNVFPYGEMPFGCTRALSLDKLEFSLLLVNINSVEIQF